MGTGEIGVPSLRWLAGSGHEVVAVYTQPDKPVGRRSVLTAPPVKVVAEELGLVVKQPERLRRGEVIAELVAMGVDLIVVMAYGQILSKAVLDAPRIACLNLHASILPKYRGAAPIQAAILNGDSETGVTVMHMAEGLDTGDVLLVERIGIAVDETGRSLHDRLAELGPIALARAMDLIEEGVVPRVPQEDALATHVGKLGREDGRVDWLKPADEIERMIRAFDPWPGTMTLVDKRDGSKPKVLKLHPPALVERVNAHGLAAGSILRSDKAGIVVATGDAGAALVLKRVQPESKNVMEVGAYLAGRPFGENGGFESPNAVVKDS